MEFVDLVKGLTSLPLPALFLGGVIYLFRCLRQDQKENKEEMKALINRYHEQQDESIVTLREIVEKLEGK